MKRFYQIDHTADVAVMLESDTQPDLLNCLVSSFACSAGADRASILTDQIEHKSFEISAQSLEQLLVRLGNHLIYEYEVNSLVAVNSSCHLQTDTSGITASMSVSFVSLDNSQALRENPITFKAATYGNMSVQFDDGVYSVCIIWDV